MVSRFVLGLFLLSSGAYAMEIIMQDPTEQQSFESAIELLSCMLKHCAVTQEKTPPNTPMSPDAAQRMVDDERSSSPVVFNCAIQPCHKSFPMFNMLQEHIFCEHGLFICQCGQFFHDYGQYCQHHMACICH